MNRRELLQIGLAAGASMMIRSLASAQTATKRLPDANYSKLPRWRGFNLLEKFNGRNERFIEDDFRMISDFGFNFVRLPMDYRVWIKDKDWKKINDDVLKEIDEAVRFGEKYGIHVNMNFHRAPGYTVAKPPESQSVWTDPEALDVCCLHWRTFAKRYKSIPNSQVSFNLFNEPGNVEDILDQCVAAHRTIIKAIREEDPNRLIICDGYNWSNNPFFDLVEDKIAQATRGYSPMEISHYKASWVNGENFPMPTWPLITGNGILFSPGKKEINEEYRKPLAIEGPFLTKTKLRFKVNIVSSSAAMTVRADGKTIFDHQFKPGPGEGEWKEVVFREQWNTYQNVYDRNYETEIPAGTKKVELLITGGDWMTLSEIGLTGEKTDKETMIPLTVSWSEAPSTFQYKESGVSAELLGGNIKDKDWLKARMKPWLELQKQGCGVMVGEFGAFSPCPHDVALRWMEDMMANWKEVGWGWAMWNFRGGFGIMDSGRNDVAYEDFHGRKLDRKMLELIQKY